MAQLFDIGTLNQSVFTTGDNFKIRLTTNKKPFNAFYLSDPEERASYMATSVECWDGKTSLVIRESTHAILATVNALKARFADYLKANPDANPYVAKVCGGLTLEQINQKMCTPIRVQGGCKIRLNPNKKEKTSICRAFTDSKEGKTKFNKRSSPEADAVGQIVQGSYVTAKIRPRFWVMQSPEKFGFCFDANMVIWDGEKEPEPFARTTEAESETEDDFNELAFE